MEADWSVWGTAANLFSEGRRNVCLMSIFHTKYIMLELVWDLIDHCVQSEGETAELTAVFLDIPEHQ